MQHRIRSAGRADAAFLLEMSCEAANWDPARMRPRADLLGESTVLRHVRGWQRPADGGVVAEDATGEPIGACWFRVPLRDEPDAAFVASGVPELTLGVRPPWRARGVGRALLVAACGAARERGHQRIGLGVHRGNFAHRLYRSEGFVVARSGDTDDVMVKTPR